MTFRRIIRAVMPASRLTQIYTGTNQIMRMVGARANVGTWPRNSARLTTGTRSDDAASIALGLRSCLTIANSWEWNRTKRTGYVPRLARSVVPIRTKRTSTFLWRAAAILEAIERKSPS